MLADDLLSSGGGGGGGGNSANGQFIKLAGGNSASG